MYWSKFEATVKKSLKIPKGNQNL